jgi:hypothetical protein
VSALPAAEIAYLEELPPETQAREWVEGERFTQPFVEEHGRHRCPRRGCTNTARYGNVVCVACWRMIPPVLRDEVVAGLRLRETRPDLWAIACEAVLHLANDYVAPNCRTRTPSSNTSPVSDPATTGGTP